MKILLFNDKPLVTVAVSEILKGLLPNAEVATAANTEILRQQTGDARWDCIIVNYAHLDTLIEEIIELGSSHANTITTLCLCEPEQVNSLKRGPLDNCITWVDNTAPLTQFVEALEKCVGIQKQFDDEPANEFRSQVQLPNEKPLTHRQVSVMDLMAKGQSVKEAARELGLSPDTVKAHLNSAYERLSVNCKASAVVAYQKAKNISDHLHSEST